MQDYVPCAGGRGRKLTLRVCSRKWVHWGKELLNRKPRALERRAVVLTCFPNVRAVIFDVYMVVR